MKIVIGGYIVGYPIGGMTWHHLQYLLGLRALGHELTYLEDGAYLPPYDPTTQTTGDATYGLTYLRETWRRYGLDDVPYHYRFGDLAVGLAIDEIERKLEAADLLICVSGITPLDWYPRPRRTLVIDTDPVFTQLRMQDDAAFLDYYRSFTHAATFGRLVGTADSPLPTHGIDWIPTNQPISLEHWSASPRNHGHFTTVGKWEHATNRTVEFAGRSFASSKAVEWDKLIDLPRRSRAFELHMAMDAIPPADRARFESGGWRFDDAFAASRDPAAYHDYITSSAGELTVVKQIYAGLPSGWFSDRSACYLAAGRPVVTQSSGFEKWLPTGEGLFSFAQIDEAAAALATIAPDYDHHSRAARRIAEEHFDAGKVLEELLDRVS